MKRDIHIKQITAKLYFYYSSLKHVWVNKMLEYT